MPTITINNLRTYVTVTSTFERWSGYPVATNLTPTSSFDGWVESGLVTDLAVTSQFTVAIDPTRTLTESLVVGSHFSCSVVSLNYIGTPISVLDPEPDQVPQATLPHNFQDAGKRGTIYFAIYHPIGTLAVVLYAPDFGDAETYRQIKEKKYSRGNTLVSFRDEEWGEEKIFEYQFSYLDKDQKALLLNLLRISLGKKVRIIDHLGETRDGFFLTPETEVFESVPRGFSATLRFQQVT